MPCVIHYVSCLVLCVFHQDVHPQHKQRHETSSGLHPMQLQPSVVVRHIMCHEVLCVRFIKKSSPNINNVITRVVGCIIATSAYICCVTWCVILCVMLCVMRQVHQDVQPKHEQRHHSGQHPVLLQLSVFVSCGASHYVSCRVLCVRFIKMSSPNMNNVIIVGCILCYFSLVLLLHVVRHIICHAVFYASGSSRCPAPT